MTQFFTSNNYAALIQTLEQDHNTRLQYQVSVIVHLVDFWATLHVKQKSTVLISELVVDFVLDMIVYQEYLVMDKIELLQALELHKKTLNSLIKEQQLFEQYLHNAKGLSKKESFRTWLS